ncbi:Serum paraoxonase/arylesterase 1 [Hypsizygus marmoreus]|uniref:Serum paraoxonase/arylesterase 1 n=1 Tax=Hypsizygus marmoreus TaxID=39966 RepID=A0A369JXM8_HYPMA|nr:Serum paraoxonase/arylesterase 1 [Hypsizygus marmoreus]
MITVGTLTKIAVVISVIAYRSARVAKNTILTKHPFPEGYYSEGNFDIDCTTLKAPDLKYCEDATFWNLLDAQGKFIDRGLLISCDANRKAWNTVMGPLTDPAPHGSLWLHEPASNTGKRNAKPDAAKLKRIELKGYPAQHDFHPLGIEIYPSYAGNASNLYVINHARARTVIEHFTLSPSSPTVATHVRTLASPYFHSANSLALTSPDSFYVTNDHLFTRRIPYLGHVLPILESVLALPLTFVSHITLSPSSSSAENAKAPITAHEFSALFLAFPNGITISPSGTQVAVASTTLGKVFIYTRNPATNALTTLAHTVEVPFTPDNMHYTHDGTALIVAGHPNFPALAKVAANKTDVAPSWVVQIAIDGEEVKEAEFDRDAPVSAKGKVKSVPGFAVKTLFQSDGVGFSSSSTGLKDPVTGALYVTGLYAEEGVLVCRPSLK